METQNIPVDFSNEHVETKIWKDSIFVPSYLVQGLSDAGMDEEWQNANVVEKDDLRVSIDLSGGLQILLDSGTRVVARHDGLMIQTLERE